MIKKPLVYYSIALYLGCFVALLFKTNKIVGAVLAASFLAVIFFTVQKKYVLFIFLFFSIGIYSYTQYFGIQLDDLKVIQLRVVQNKEFYTIAKYKGRKVILEGNILKAKEGQKILAQVFSKKESQVERGIVGTFYVENFKGLDKDFIFALHEWKTLVYDKLSTKMGSEKAAFVMAICFGDTKYLSKNQNNGFQQLGVIHAVSVSGFHMAIIYQVLEKSLGIYLATGFSVLYAIFTGGGASTVRALLMILILKFSKKFFRNYDSLSSLSLAAMLLLIFEPYNVTDLGFHLSFLATLGILLYYKPLKKKLYRLPKKMNESLSITLSAQCFSTPFAIFSLQTFSLGFLMGNLVLLPFYSAVVIIGNLLLFLLKIPLLFNGLVWILYQFLIAVDGIESLILRITPPVGYYTYIDGLFLLLLYGCYQMLKRGYKKVKYLPVLFFLLLLFQNYSVTLQISFVTLPKEQCVVIRYHNKSILFTSRNDYKKEELEFIKQRVRVAEIITSADNEFLLNINNKYKVIILKEDKSVKNALDLKVKTDERESLFIHNPLLSKIKLNKKQYDIIRVPQYTFNTPSRYYYKKEVTYQFFLHTAHSVRSIE